MTLQISMTPGESRGALHGHEFFLAHTTSPRASDPVRCEASPGSPGSPRQRRAIAEIADLTDLTDLTDLDAVTLYKRQFRAIPLLDEAQEKRLGRLLRSGSPRQRAHAKQRLYEANLRLTWNIAGRFAATSDQQLDIAQTLNVRMWQRMDSFDPERGAFTTYMTLVLLTTAQRARDEQAQLVHRPEYVRSLDRRVRRRYAELLQERQAHQACAFAAPAHVDGGGGHHIGAAASADDLFEQALDEALEQHYARRRTAPSAAAIAADRTRRAVAQTAHSGAATLSVEGIAARWRAERSSEGNVAGDWDWVESELESSGANDRYAVELLPEDAPESNIELVDLRERVAAWVAKTLTPRQAQVLWMRFDEGLTLQEIGERIGLSRQRVHQMFGRALTRLRQAARYDPDNTIRSLVDGLADGVSEQGAMTW